MRSLKAWTLLLLLLLAGVLCLSSCRESDESKYDRARQMVVEGQYAEAMPIFEELADYQQADRYLTYCKALAAGNDGDYQTAIEQLSKLSDFEESDNYRTYYEAIVAETGIDADSSEAWRELLAVGEAYDSLGHFRDSKERADNCRRRVYDMAVTEAADLDYEAAITKLEALGGYGDSADLIRHYQDEQTKAYTVTAFRWERRIVVEENVAHNGSDWELPEGAELTDQKEEIHHYDQTVDHFEETSIVRSKREIDHYAEYSTFVDKGNGVFGEVVYRRPVYSLKAYIDSIAAPVYSQTPVYRTKYYYNVREWEQTRTVESGEDDHAAVWPDAGLTEFEREGDKAEAYYFSVKINGDEPARTFMVSEDVWNSINLNDTVYLTVVHSTDSEYLSTKTGEKLSDLQQIH